MLSTIALFVFSFFVTLPATVVAKYCDEHACLCVCLSTSISPEPHSRSVPYFCVCCLWLRLGHPLAWWLPAWWLYVASPIGGRGWRECTARAKCNLRLPCYSLFSLVLYGSLIWLFVSFWAHINIFIPSYRIISH